MDSILQKARQAKGLSVEEAEILLRSKDDEIFKVAGEVKRRIYGDRVVMFAPLYISDYCINGCTYCGFGIKERHTPRRLDMDEIRQEAKALLAMGHKRIALEAGEDPENCPLSYILEAISTIYETGIRRINVNIAALDEDGYRKLKKADIGTYILFQETYCKETYKAMHPTGPKSDYLYHLEAHDRAIKAGIDDVGGGVLFGLHKDPIYEALEMIRHNQILESRYGVGFHTLSAPRINGLEHSVDDDTFLRIVAVLRLAVPYTGIIISTRESPEMRRKLINIGVSQISAASSVEVGGYSGKNGSKQFGISDHRKMSDIVAWLLDEGLIPSFCTACYRSNRTGDRFMDLAKSGDISEFCTPNALFTLAEYLADRGDDLALIEKKLDEMPDSPLKERSTANIQRIKAGERDLFL